MQRSRPRSWDTVGSSTSRVSWVAIPRPSGWGLGNWKGRTTSIRVAREKRGWTETVDQFRLGSRVDFPQSARGPYRGRPDAARGEVDELVAAADRQADEEPGDSCQSRHRLSVAQETWVPKAEGVEEENDGAPPSGS